MQPARWDLLKSLFEAALHCPPDQRSAFLDEVCGANLDLRRDLENLLRNATSSDDSLPAPALRLAEDHTGNPLRPGERIGSYEVVRLLGAGGMGAVYLAARG